MSPDYFETMRIPLGGRFLTERDVSRDPMLAGDQSRPPGNIGALQSGRRIREDSIDPTVSSSKSSGSSATSE